MRAERAELQRIDESRRRLRAPRVRGRRWRQSVEGVVELDGVEQRRVVLEPTLRRYAGRIDDAAPVLVHPSGAADACFSHRWSYVPVNGLPLTRSTVVNDSTASRVSFRGWWTGRPSATTAATASSAGASSNAFMSSSWPIVIVVMTPPSPSARAASRRFHTNG